MEKRVFIAIGVSIAFLWVWAALAPRLFPQLQQQKTVASKKSSPATKDPAVEDTRAPIAATTTASKPAMSSSAPVVPVSATSEELIDVKNENFLARFSNRGAQLVSFQLQRYREKDGDRLVDLVKGRPRTRTDFPFAIESANARVAETANTALYTSSETTATNGVRTINFRYVGEDGLSVTKTFRVHPDFLIDFEFAISPAVPYRTVVGPGIRTLTGTEEDSQVLVTGNGIVQRDGDATVLPREKGDRLKVYPDAQFIGIEDNYFLTAIKPERASSSILRRIEVPTGKIVRKELYAGVSATNGVVSGRTFMGPKETKLLDRLGFSSVLQFGWFGVIARFLLTVLVWINTFTKNYGFAIIVLTILIKIVLYPLQHKSIVSMKKMQKAQPKMEAIKARYKKARSDPEQRQKMNVEMMKLYQTEGINPASGCVPILLQMPILWGFYGLLSQAIELRGAPFIWWIHDLSDKDPYYITPILMTATMFIQTYITPTTGDPAQRRIFLAMPIVFGWIFKEFPSGLVLYWLVQNILTIAQQMIMNKWWKDHPDEIQKA
jgi:YidC/Oxa1 family membrane protein insertase